MSRVGRGLLGLAVASAYLVSAGGQPAEAALAISRPVPTALPRGANATVHFYCPEYGQAQAECAGAIEDQPPRVVVSGPGAHASNARFRYEGPLLDCSPGCTRPNVVYFDLRLEPGAPVGRRDISVAWANGGTSRCPACFGVLPTHTTFRAFPMGGNVAVLPMYAPGRHVLVVGAGPGQPPEVRIYTVDELTAEVRLLRRFLAYERDFRGGVHVAGGKTRTANGELWVGAGRGRRPEVRVYDVAANGDVQVKTSFLAYPSGFGGGVTVAAMAAMGGYVVTGTGAGGGPHVRVWRLRATGGAAEVAGFFAFSPLSRRGVNVTAGSVCCDGHPNVIVGDGPGAAPTVRDFTQHYDDYTLQEEFTAYGADFRGGVTVAYDQYRLVTGPASHGGPQIREWDLVDNGDGAGAHWDLAGSYFLYSSRIDQGLSVALAPWAESIAVPRGSIPADVRIRWYRGALCPFC